MDQQTRASSSNDSAGWLLFVFVIPSLTMLPMELGLCSRIEGCVTVTNFYSYIRDLHHIA